MNVINKWQKTGIIFKNEVLHVLNAEIYPDHPNSLEKSVDGGEGTPQG